MLIGSLLLRWERAFGRDPAGFLGAEQANMTSLALCMRPDPETWVADIADVASVCGLDEARLAVFLRQAMSAERLASAPAVAGVVDGRLLAARDRTEDGE
jgi:hypothetical protein